MSTGGLAQERLKIVSLRRICRLTKGRAWPEILRLILEISFTLVPALISIDATRDRQNQDNINDRSYGGSVICISTLMLCVLESKQEADEGRETTASAGGLWRVHRGSFC